MQNTTTKPDSTNIYQTEGYQEQLLPDNIPLKLESLEYLYHGVIKHKEPSRDIIDVVYTCNKCNTKQIIRYTANGTPLTKLKNDRHPCTQQLCSASVDKYEDENFKRLDNYNLVGKIINPVGTGIEEVCVNILNDGTIVCVEQLNLISIVYKPEVFRSLTELRDKSIKAQS